MSGAEYSRNACESKFPDVNLPYCENPSFKLSLLNGPSIFANFRSLVDDNHSLCYLRGTRFLNDISLIMLLLFLISIFIFIFQFILHYYFIYLSSLYT